jgi:hypothetical protein|tara:strand:- start:20 stop:184 length:165 start_codon:yes stop_codon:yes gene_type:complete
MTKVLDKKIRLFRGEFIGWDYTFDCDIEIYVSSSNEIEDYSGCSYETAKKLIGA